MDTATEEVFSSRIDIGERSCRKAGEFIKACRLKHYLHTQKVVTNTAVLQHGMLPRKGHSFTGDVLCSIAVGYLFRISRIKLQAMLRPGRIHFGRDREPGVKLEFYNAVAAYPGRKRDTGGYMI